MRHPCYAGPDWANSGTRRAAERGIESRALKSDRIKELAASEGIQLVSYPRTSRRIQDNAEKAERVASSATSGERRATLEDYNK